MSMSRYTHAIIDVCMPWLCLFIVGLCRLANAYRTPFIVPPITDVNVAMTINTCYGL